tara:strand:- start:8593 stop:8874 length:282 start_codon:yes stop_codon:yes gene_type:complete
MIKVHTVTVAFMRHLLLMEQNELACVYGFFCKNIINAVTNVNAETPAMKAKAKNWAKGSALPPSCWSTITTTMAPIAPPSLSSFRHLIITNAC